MHFFNADGELRVIAPLPPRRRRARSAACIFAAAMLAGLASCKKSESPAATVPAAPPTSAPATAATKGTAPAPPEAVRKLYGRWMRLDGGYVLELRNAELSGVIEAGYFNPKPIKVSRAVWMQGGAGLQVAVELNDVGYPGATYVLTYDPQADRLVGQYTQPQMQQSFDIEFVRQPNP